MSRDNGASWSVNSSGLQSGYAQRLAITSQGTLILATDNGMYRHPGFAPNAVSYSEPNGDVISMEVYPNPTGRDATLSVVMTHSERTAIALFDAVGREVRSIYAGDISQGKTEFKIATSNLPAGAYFCRVESAAGVAARLLILSK